MRYQESLGVVDRFLKERGLKWVVACRSNNMFVPVRSLCGGEILVYHIVQDEVSVSCTVRLPFVLSKDKSIRVIQLMHLLEMLLHTRNSSFDIKDRIISFQSTRFRSKDSTMTKLFFLNSLKQSISVVDKFHPILKSLVFDDSSLLKNYEQVLLGYLDQIQDKRPTRLRLLISSILSKQNSIDKRFQTYTHWHRPCSSAQDPRSSAQG